MGGTAVADPQAPSRALTSRSKCFVLTGSQGVSQGGLWRGWAEVVCTVGAWLGRLDGPWTSPTRRCHGEETPDARAREDARGRGGGRTRKGLSRCGVCAAATPPARAPRFLPE